MANTTMQRRSFMTGLLGSAFVVSTPRRGLAYSVAEGPARCEYAILIDGRDSGRHSIQVKTAGDHCIATMRSTADVRVLAIPVFRYDHFSQEVWNGPALAGFDSRTDDNGRALQVAGHSTSSGFLVNVRGKIAILPPDVAPATYWNRAILERVNVLDPEDGRLFRHQVGRERTTGLAWARTGNVAEVNVTSFTSGVVWYDGGGRFLGGRFQKDSHDIEFRALPA
jgi:Family of unknown function (DUF6134)